MALKLATISLVYVSLLSGFALATPAVDVQELEARQAVDNIVYVTDSNLFWYVRYCGSPIIDFSLTTVHLQPHSMIMPRSAVPDLYRIIVLTKQTATHTPTSEIARSQEV